MFETDASVCFTTYMVAVLITSFLLSFMAFPNHKAANEFAA